MSVPGEVGRWYSTQFSAPLVVMALHLLAVSFCYASKRQNLVGSMITGKPVR